MCKHTCWLSRRGIKETGRNPGRHRLCEKTQQTGRRQSLVVSFTGDIANTTKSFPARNRRSLNVAATNSARSRFTKEQDNQRSLRTKRKKKNDRERNSFRSFSRRLRSSMVLTDTTRCERENRPLTLIRPVKCEISRALSSTT